MKTLATLLAVGCAALSSACYWDRDSLEFEAKRMPEVLQAITGRFDRNPPLYYSMRLERVTGEITQHPDQLSLYDDAGVSASRLGHQDEAIRWMEQKRQHLDSAHANSDDRYKTESNEGTFELLAWFALPDHLHNRTLLKRAIGRIEQALSINPHAHFDREKYQLAYMRWLAGDPGKDGIVNWMPVAVLDHKDKSADRAAQVKGLTGLIVLGPAWENPDILGALADTLGEPAKSSAGRRDRTPSTAYLATLRRQELIGKGQVALDKTFFGEGSLDSGDHAYVEAQYERLRAEADTYEARRAEYMETRMKAGRHPDIDAEFWKGWVEVPPPAVEPMGWFGRHRRDLATYAIMMILVAGPVLLLWLVIRLALRLNRRISR